jgi:putative endonuclease
MPSTYTLECADGSYYCGSTWNLDRRLREHNDGVGCAYTRPVRRRPVLLVWHREFERVDEAFALEKQIQNWSRAKRQALIDGRIDEIALLAGRSYAAQDLRGALQGHVLTNDEDSESG